MAVLALVFLVDDRKSHHKDCESYDHQSQLKVHVRHGGIGHGASGLSHGLTQRQLAGLQGK